MNHSELSRKIARLIKDELTIQGGFPADIVSIVVDNFDLENRGLGDIVAEIARIVKTVAGGNL